MLTDWRVAAAAAIFCTGLLVTCIETSAQSMPKDVAARTEIYAIPSLTISDQQFLTGDANGKQVTVAGEFRIAQGSGKLPVVVLMHGSSGVGAGMDPWVRHFNAMGISTFVIDGFSGRGLTAVGPRTRPCSAGSTSSSISTARWRSSPNIRASILTASC